MGTGIPGASTLSVLVMEVSRLTMRGNRGPPQAGWEVIPLVEMPERLLHLAKLAEVFDREV